MKKYIQLATTLLLFYCAFGVAALVVTALVYPFTNPHAYEPKTAKQCLTPGIFNLSVSECYLKFGPDDVCPLLGYMGKDSLPTGCAKYF
jgi:hypothetical protein